MNHDAWTLNYDTWDPDREPLREALCTLGNGYLATRGAAEEATAGGPHYPGTYLARGYNRRFTRIRGRPIENEDLVNWPNWLRLSFRPRGGDWFDLDSVELLGFRQVLDMRRGVLERRLRFRDRAGRITSLHTRRIVSMASPHLAGIEWTLTPENWSGAVELRSTLDGRVTNRGVERYRQLNGDHLEPLHAESLDNRTVRLLVETNQSRMRMAQAARTDLWLDGEPVEGERQTIGDGATIGEAIHLPVRENRTVRIEKIVSVFTSRDRAISEESLAAAEAVRRAGSFGELLEPHRKAWERLWNRCDIELSGHAEAQRILRLHLFHLLQTVSWNSMDLDWSVPARGLHGEAYRGHIFWDELFILPLLNLRLPELARGSLMYRYRRLPAARRLAQEAGLRGAMFPWQSGSDGREESQLVHLNPRSGRWVPDDSRRQRHINGAIAYNIWQYMQTTGDRAFLAAFGAEMLIALGRFWSSLAVHNPERDRYEIRGVVGPDEFHTRYPGRDEPGLNNNAYTNVLAAWTLCRAMDALERIDELRRAELCDQLALSDAELRHWDELSRRMFIPFHEGRIISQFEGYEDLEEFDWDYYQRKYGDIQRLDRILEAEGDSPNRYKASKQADVLMLFYLFSTEELTELFERLGYGFDGEMMLTNIGYYRRRTSHGSTLSRIVHSWVEARSDRQRAWRLFEEALQSDVADIQGGTTSEGIHLGAMAGTVDLIQRGHTGIEVRDDVLWFNPCLPRELEEIRFRLHYRGHRLALRLTQRELSLAAERSSCAPILVGFHGQVHSLREGENLRFEL